MVLTHTADGAGPHRRQRGRASASPPLHPPGIQQLCAEYAMVTRRILAEWDASPTVRRALIAHAARLLHYRLMDWRPYWRTLDEARPRILRHHALAILPGAPDVDLVLIAPRQDARPVLIEPRTSLAVTLVLRGPAQMRRCIRDPGDRSRLLVRDGRRLEPWSVWVHEPGARAGAVGFAPVADAGGRHPELLLVVVVHMQPHGRHAYLLARGRLPCEPGTPVAVRRFRPHRRQAPPWEVPPTTALS